MPRPVASTLVVSALTVLTAFSGGLPAVANLGAQPAGQGTSQTQGSQQGVSMRTLNRTPNPNAADCNPRGDADVKACLVPGNDVMADQGKRIAPGVDCFWRTDDTKRFEDIAGESNGQGVSVQFRFIIANKCAVPVEVQFTLAAPGANPLEFTDCAGTVLTQTLAAGAAPLVRSCMSIPYRRGTLTFTRAFSIAGRTPGAGTFVAYDPEVVIEEGRAP